MSQLHEEIKTLLLNNGINWQENISLAKGIKELTIKFSSDIFAADLLKANLFTEENLKGGTDCPVCRQRVKMYKPGINHDMALCLISLYKLDKNNPEHIWWHVSDDIKVSFKVSGAFAKLRHWGLIEMKPKEEGMDKKRTSGMWRITELGKDFVMSKAAVQAHAKLFNATLYGLEGDQISIQDCLAEGFNFQELMNR